MLRRLAALPVILLVVFAASGWLYLMRLQGGPPVGDALPLDELSRHASVSLAWFLVVWGAAGAVRDRPVALVDGAHDIAGEKRLPRVVGPDAVRPLLVGEAAGRAERHHEDHRP